MSPGEERLRDASITARPFAPTAGEDDPPQRARVVVIGAGIVGCSVAFHLAALGWTDIVVERARVGSGTSWHAAGLVTRARGEPRADHPRLLQPRLLRRARAHGHRRRLYENGSLSVAQNPERMTELEYGLALARYHGLPAPARPCRRRRRPGRRSTPAGWSAGRCSRATPPSTPAAPRWRRPRRPSASACVSSRTALYVGLAAARRGGRRRRDRSRCDRVRDGGDRGRPVVARLGALAGAPLALYAASTCGRRPRPSWAPGAAFRSCVTSTATSTCDHYRGGFVVGAFEPDGLPCPPAELVRRFRLRRAARRLGALRAVAREGATARAGPAGRPRWALLERARELHSRRRLPARRDRRGRGPLRRRRA